MLVAAAGTSYEMDRYMLTRTVIQHMMGFYLTVGLTMTVLPGFVMAHDGRAVYLRRMGQALIGFSVIVLAIATAITGQ